MTSQGMQSWLACMIVFMCIWQSGEIEGEMEGKAVIY